MDKLDHRQLTLIKRAAEDAIHACNRHYGPFVDVVAHPLNIIALVEMAQSRQAEVADKDQRIHELNETSLDLEGQIYKLQEQLNEKDKRIAEACESINSFFDNQVSTPTPREYANFIAEILETLRGEHEA